MIATYVSHLLISASIYKYLPHGRPPACLTYWIGILIGIACPRVCQFTELFQNLRHLVPRSPSDVNNIRIRPFGDLMLVILFRFRILPESQQFLPLRSETSYQYAVRSQVDMGHVSGRSTDAPPLCHSQLRPRRRPFSWIVYSRLQPLLPFLPGNIRKNTFVKDHMLHE